MIKKQLINLLQKSKTPISVPDILKRIKANKTTIYRELETLLSGGFIIESNFGDGKKRYEISNRNHHHHLICKSCGKVQDVELNEKPLLTKVRDISNFQIENHTIEFFGKCNNCQI